MVHVTNGHLAVYTKLPPVRLGHTKVEDQQLKGERDNDTAHVDVAQYQDEITAYKNSQDNVPILPSNGMAYVEKRDNVRALFKNYIDEFTNKSVYEFIETDELKVEQEITETDAYSIY